MLKYLLLTLLLIIPVADTKDSGNEVDEFELAEKFRKELNVEWLHLTIDNSNNIVVTGFFSDTLKAGRYKLTSDGGLDIFIAKYSPAHELMWIKHAGGANVDFSKFINTDANDNIYIQGMFRGDARFGQFEFESRSYEYFTAKFDNEGELIWVKTRKTMMQTERAKKSKRISDYTYTELPK